jgi:hypothetical protein
MIQSGKIPSCPNIELNEEQKQAILEFSDDFNLNEIECLNLWIEMSDPMKRRLLECSLNQPYGSLDEDIPHAVRELFSFTQDCEINTVLELMKARYDHSLISSKRNMIMIQTNRLLCGEIATHIFENLLRNFQNHGQNLLKLVRQQGGSGNSGSTSTGGGGGGGIHTGSQRTQSNWKHVHAKLAQQTECLFYIFYQTQITSKENKLLLELIELLSELVLLKDPHEGHTSSHTSNGRDGEFNSTGLSTSGGVFATIPIEWSDSLYQLLVVLQLTHICAMEQIQTLYSRHNDSPPYLLEAVGNEILPQPGSYDGMDQVRWKNGMAQGFTCLVLAILRQPYIDMRDPAYSPDEVYWLLDQASQLQAYSYLRLCLLPVLQSFSLTSNETSTHSLYMAIISNFIHNLLTIFCLPVYDHLGFPFPDSKLKHSQDVQWLIQEYEKQEQNLLLNGGDYGDGGDLSYGGGRYGGVGFGEGDESSSPLIAPIEYYGYSKLIQRDCLDDVLDLLSAMLLANPNYAAAFWVPGKYHPFTLRVLQGVTTDSSLILPCLHFLTGLSSGLNSCTCEPVYHFLNQKLTGFFDWNRFFTLLRQYADDLTNASSGGAVTSSASNSSSHSNSMISQEDSDVLEGIVNLIGAVMKHPSVTHALLSDGLDPIAILFNLFVCRIDYTLKGSILRTLSAICASTSVAYHMSLSLASGTASDQVQSPEAIHTSLGGRIVEQIWSAIEYYHLLPCVGTGGITNSHHQKELGGLIYELESVETITGNYPVTDGFLTLLSTLLQHEYGIPVNLGYGYRIPGIVCYVDYLVSEILLKMHLRSYSSDGHGQLWRILSQTILILVSIIQAYPINTVTIDDLIQHKTLIKSSSSTTQEGKVGLLSSSSKENGTTPTPSSLFQNKSQLYLSLLEDFSDLDAFFPIESNTQVQSDSSSSSRPFPMSSKGLGSSSVGIGRSSQGFKRQVNMIQKVPKPKSAGFAVMCHVLHNSRRLFDHLIQILRQNSSASLLFSRDKETQRKCHISLEIMKGILHENQKLWNMKERKEKKKLNQFRDGGRSGSSGSFSGGIYPRGGGRGGGIEYEDEMIEGINTELELPKYGWDEFAYDLPYWKYRTVAAILGLFYEVSLREQVFLNCVRFSSSSSPLTILRTERVNEPPILLSVQLTELSVFMTSVLNGQPLTDITNYLTLVPESLITYPSVPVIAVRLLQYVSSSQLPSKILNTLYNSTNGDRIISSCTQALERGNEGLVISSATNPYAYATRRYGGGSNDIIQSMGLIFTPSHSYTLSSGLASYSYYFSTLNSSSSHSKHSSSLPVDSHLSHVFKENNDIREAILDLLLLTFSPTKSCLCHYLLGLLDSVDSVIGGKHSIEYRTSLTSFISRGYHMRPGFPANCLDAIIDLISSPSSSLSSLLSSNPLQGLKCYELLYRLCSSQLTNHAIMKILWMRRESPKYTHFFQPHLERFLNYYLHPSSPSSSSESLIDDTARFNSCAWILKMIALELHSIELSAKEVVPQSAIQAILNLFFDPDSRANQLIQSAQTATGVGGSAMLHTTAGTRKNNQSILLLKILNILPLDSLSSQLEGYDSPIGVQCMKKCSEAYHVSYGLPSRDSSVASSRNEPPGQFSYINIQNLIDLLHEVIVTPLTTAPTTSGKVTGVPSSASSSSSMALEQQIVSTVKAALQYNKYNMLLASLANLFHGWRQFVDVSLLGCGSLLIGQFDSEWGKDPVSLSSSSHLSKHQSNSSSISLALDKLVHFLIMPVLNLLVTQPSLEMILAEQLARSLLSMTALLRDICGANALPEEEETRDNSGNQFPSCHLAIISLFSLSDFDSDRETNLITKSA